MSSFGERLRQERENRSATLEEIGSATGIQVGYLDALERNAFDDLPGRAFGKLYIRAYAETLGFDPGPLIEAYDREQRLRAAVPAGPGRAAAPPRPLKAALARFREERIAERAKTEQAVPPVPLEEPIESAPPALQSAPDGEPAPLEEEKEDVAPIASPASTASAPRRWRSVLVALGLVVLAAGGYTLVKRRDVEGSRQASAAPIRTTPQETSPPIDAPIVATPSPSPAPELPKTLPQAPAAGELGVSEFGVGRRIVAGRLEGQGEPFTQGEAASFWTRVVGGTRGQSIRHVWLHEGRITQTIPLRLGGPSWATHSSKRLGQPGEWAVEARDAQGRVLARSTFRCAPAER